MDEDRWLSLVALGVGKGLDYTRTCSIVDDLTESESALPARSLAQLVVDRVGYVMAANYLAGPSAESA